GEQIPRAAEADAAPRADVADQFTPNGNPRPGVDWTTGPEPPERVDQRRPTSNEGMRRRGRKTGPSSFQGSFDFGRPYDAIRPPSRRSPTPTAPSQARRTEGRETGPSDFGYLFEFGPLESVLPLSTELRLSIASDHAGFAVDQVHEHDPNRESNLTKIARSATDEEKIRHYKEVIDEAVARFQELLRQGVGANNGLSWRDTAPPIDGQRAIAAYRERHNLLEGHRSDEEKHNVIAFILIDGVPIFGMNSGATTYTPSDRRAARRLRKVLIDMYLNVMKTVRIGRHPNDAVFHAEITALLRAAAANGGTLAD